MKRWRLKIHGKPVEVVEVPTTEFDSGRYGESDVRRCVIRLAGTGSLETKLQTLFHEYLHFVVEDFSIELDERDIQTLAMAWYWFLSENDVNVKKLMRGGDGGKT